MTPLQSALIPIKLSIAKILLKHGADVEVKSRLGYSPLHMAINKGNISLAKLLLEYGARGGTSWIFF